MIPQSLGAIIAFLGLVAPGILFENLRNRRRLGQGESTFREISRIALSSFLLSLTSVSLILTNRFWRPQLVVDPRLWIDQGTRYVRENYVLVAYNFLVALVLALLIAVLVDTLLAWGKKGNGSLAWHSIWYEEFRINVPVGTKPWAHVRLTNGDSFYGLVKDYTSSGKPEDREIALEGVGLTEVQHKANGELVKNNIGQSWETVIIPGPEIRYIRVQYLDNLTSGIVLTDRRKEAIERTRQHVNNAQPEPDSTRATEGSIEAKGSE